MLAPLIITSLLLGQVGPRCEDPNLLFLLDVSGTMKQKVDDKTKYTHAVEAITGITSARDDIRYGLSVFPKPFKTGDAQSGYCFMNSGMVVDFSDASETAITGYLTPGAANYFGGPSGNNDTPIFQALEQANTFNGFNDSTRRQAIVLITDGIQDCCRGRYLFPNASPPQDFNSASDCPGYPDVTLDEAEKINNRQAIVALTAQVAARNVSVFVVGFGSAVDPLMLGSMAEAAGTKRTPNCNPQQADGSQNDICYYRANNASELLAALQAIAREITTEVCDGLDNDCNGQIDDNVTRACQGCNGVGTEACTNGQWSGQCSAPVQAEACDGIDNDCNGQIDSENCTTQCGPGVRTCEGGVFGACRPAASIEELCNGRDDNCDGQIDEGCECQTDEIRPCNLNTCAGQQRCKYGKWEACVAASASAEVCDGTDNDCDGKVDDGLNLCGPGIACINGKCPTQPQNQNVDANTERFLGSGIARGCHASGLTSPFGLILAAFGLTRAFRRIR